MTGIHELGYERLTGPQLVNRLGQEGVLEMPATLDDRAPYLAIGGQVVDAVRGFPAILGVSRISRGSGLHGSGAIITLEFLGVLDMPNTFEEREKFLRIGGQVFEAMRTEGVN